MLIFVNFIDYTKSARSQSARRSLFNHITISANTAPETFARSSGFASICQPILPALTSIVSQFCALASKTVRYRFFMPTGEQPPRT